MKDGAQRLGEGDFRVAGEKKQVGKGKVMWGGEERRSGNEEIQGKKTK